jgi:hypothetical protein
LGCQCRPRTAITAGQTVPQTTLHSASDTTDTGDGKTSSTSNGGMTGEATSTTQREALVARPRRRGRDDGDDRPAAAGFPLLNKGQCYYAVGEFEVADWKIGEGGHYAESAEPFGILNIGYTPVTSYAYPGGTRLKVINPQ